MIYMTLLKIGAVKDIFHGAGFKRVSSKSINALEEAVSDVVERMAKDAVVVYGDRQLESHELERLTKVKEYRVMVVLREPDDLDIKELLKEEQMPEGWDSDEEVVEEEVEREEGQKEEENSGE